MQRHPRSANPVPPRGSGRDARRPRLREGAYHEPALGAGCFLRLRRDTRDSDDCRQLGDLRAAGQSGRCLRPFSRPYRRTARPASFVPPAVGEDAARPRSSRVGRRRRSRSRLPHPPCRAAEARHDETAAGAGRAAARGPAESHPPALAILSNRGPARRWLRRLLQVPSQRHGRGGPHDDPRRDIRLRAQFRARRRFAQGCPASRAAAAFPRGDHHGRRRFPGSGVSRGEFAAEFGEDAGDSVSEILAGTPKIRSPMSGRHRGRASTWQSRASAATARRHYPYPT